MKIRFTKHFEKQFSRLDHRRRARVLHIIRLFTENSFHPLLRNHALHGHLTGMRAIAAGGDIRIIFEEFQNYTLVIFLDVGTHNQVYP